MQQFLSNKPHGHKKLWLKHRIASPRFTRVEYLPPSNYLSQFRITSEKELDAQVLAWLREAYKVGQ